MSRSPDKAGDSGASIRTSCPNCSRPLKVKATFAGKRVKCPQCQNPVPIPELSEEPDPQPARSAPQLPPRVGQKKRRVRPQPEEPTPDVLPKLPVAAMSGGALLLVTACLLCWWMFSGDGDPAPEAVADADVEVNPQDDPATALVATLRRLTKDYGQIPIDIYAMRQSTQIVGQQSTGTSPLDPAPQSFNEVKACVEAANKLIAMGEAAMPALLHSLEHEYTPIVVPESASFGLTSRDIRHRSFGRIEFGTMPITLTTADGGTRHVDLLGSDRPDTWLTLILSCMKPSHVNEIQALRWHAGGAHIQLGAQQVLKNWNVPQDDEIPEQAIGAMIVGLGSVHDSVRAYSLESLQGLPADPRYLPQLLSALEAKSNDAKPFLLNVLTSMPGDAIDAQYVPDLVKAARSSHPDVQAWSLQVLQDMGKTAVDPLRDALQGPLEERETAVRILGRLGPVAREASDEVVALVSAESSNSRLIEAAMEALGQIDAPVEKVIPAIDFVMDAPNRKAGSAKMTSVRVLQKLYADAVKRPLAERPPALQPDSLIPRLVGYRIGPAAELLVEIGPEAVPALLEALDPNQSERDILFITETLVKIRPLSDDVVPALVSVLMYEPTEKTDRALVPYRIRQEMIQLLGELGPAAASAIPTLVPLLNEITLADDVREALEQIGSPSIDLLKSFLADASALTNSYAIDQLEGFSADEVVAAKPELIAFLQAEGTKAKVGNADRQVMLILARIGATGDADAVETLIEQLQRHPSARRGDESIRNALVVVGPPAAQPVAMLLTHDEPNIRLRALKILATMGENAQEVRPLIENAQKTETNSDVQGWFETALDRIP